jgi:hypothetical protein
LRARSFGASAQKAKEKGSHHFEENGLADDQGDGDESIELDVSLKKMSQPVGQKMKDKEKVDNNQDAVDCEFSQEGKERLARVGFHQCARTLRESSSTLDLAAGWRCVKQENDCARGESSYFRGRTRPKSALWLMSQTNIPKT